MNLAAAWKLPVCFFIENNLYAVSTRADEVTRRPAPLRPRAGFRHPGLARRRHGSARRAPRDERGRRAAAKRARARRSSRPRSTATSTRTARIPGSAFGYRDEGRGGGLARARPARPRRAGDGDARPAQRRGGAAVRDAGADGDGGCGGRDCSRTTPRTPGQRRIRPELWPDPAVRRRRHPRRRVASSTASRQSDRSSTHCGGRGERRTLRRRGRGHDGPAHADDERIVVLGEDVHRLEGGTNGATKGLAQKYGPDRVHRHAHQRERVLRAGRRASPSTAASAPSWSSCTRTSCGSPPTRSSTRSARRGTCSAATTRAARAAHQGRDGVGVRLAAPDGSGGDLRDEPGWRIVAPSTAADYVGLMNAALALDDPVLVIEHVDLYGHGRSGSRRRSRLRPPARARRRAARGCRRDGSQLSVHGGPCAGGREQTGIDAEVIDLRWLDRASLDWETIGASIRKTNNVLIVEQGARGPSYGGVARRRDPAPPLRLAGPAGGAGDRRRGESEHLSGPRARGDRAHRRSRRRARTSPRRVGRSADGGRGQDAGRRRGRCRSGGSGVAGRGGRFRRAAGSRSSRSRRRRRSSSTRRSRAARLPAFSWRPERRRRSALRSR